MPIPKVPQVGLSPNSSQGTINIIKELNTFSTDVEAVVPYSGRIMILPQAGASHVTR